MRFSKPISREVDIDGNTFVLTFSDLGIEFRLKGKRRTANANWTDVLNAARGDQGESLHEFLGIAAGASSPHETEPQTTGQSEATSKGLETVGETGTGRTGETNNTREEMGRAVTAGEPGSES